MAFCKYWAFKCFMVWKVNLVLNIFIVYIYIYSTICSYYLVHLLLLFNSMDVCASKNY